MTEPASTASTDFRRDSEDAEIVTANEGSPRPSLSQRALAASGQAPARQNDYLEGLNPEQCEAVTTLDGPLLVLAGAGTGKTRVLTTRIAHILATKSAWPSQILSVTFTNKAAREMRERVTGLVGGAVEGMPWLGTFHSIGVKMLRRNAELVGLRSDFTILDWDDHLRLLKQLIEAADIDSKRWPARQLASHIDGWKNRGLTPDQVPKDEGFGYANGAGLDLYKQYQARLKVLNAADFGDLLVEPIRLMRDNKDVLADYHRRFQYILVDEYQDTNVAQYLWLRLLAQGSHNICCVGDDDQSIYGWRGAEVDNILRFEKDFPGSKIVRLVKNYRSTSHILEAANGLIAHNEARLGKDLTSVGEAGEKIKVRGCWDSEEEARYVGETIEDFQRQGHALNEIAILMRASFQMREFEDRFVTLGLPYRVIGGPRFYERAEIRDALAYFRATVQPADDLAFERIVNTPRRGLGDATMKIVHAHARRNGIPLMQAVRELIETEELKARPRKALTDLIRAFERWREQLDTLKHTHLAEIILEESGYTEMWQQDKSADAPGRLENLKELVRGMDAFETMAGFLEHISLVMDTDGGAASDDKVSLMTLHGAKGLEFDTVFLPGWEEGLFPHQRSLDQEGQAGLEEERRLAYVGITRARRNSTVCFASNRRIHGLWQTTVPSRFVDEIPEAHVEVVEAGGNGGYGGYGQSRFERSGGGFSASSYETPGWQRAKRNAAEKAKNALKVGQIRTIEGDLIATATTKASFATGDKVHHDKFGPGIVQRAEGNKLTIDFAHAGQKRVLDSFVKRA